MRKHQHPPADWNGDGAANRSEGTAPAGMEETVERQAQPETNDFAQFLRQIRESGEYLLYYLSARADGAKFGLRNFLINLMLASFGFMVVSSLFLGAIWLSLNGAAEGLGLLCGNRPWAGNLLAGSLLLVGLAAGISIGISWFKKNSLASTVEKYEQRQSRQQACYGHNVADRATKDHSNEK